MLITGGDRPLEDRIRGLLRGRQPFRLEECGVFSSAEAALECCREMRPDLLLLHARVPDASMADMVRRVSGVSRKTRVLLLVRSPGSTWILRCLERGASGCVLVGELERELPWALEALLQGGAPVNARVASRLLGRLRRQAARGDECPVLSAREEQVLALLGEGKIYKEIGVALHLSFHTVRAHVRRLYKKLRVRTRHAAIQKAPSLARGQG